MKTYEANLHTLTPITVYENEDTGEFQTMNERHFEIVGFADSDKWDTYYLLQILSEADKRQKGRMTLTIPTKHLDTPLYSVGDRVAVGWSGKYKHFYIRRKE